MKILTSFTAYDIIDAENDNIQIAAEGLENGTLRFCVEVKKNSGVVYREVTPGCVAYYAKKTGRDVEQLVNRTKARGEELYWLNNTDSSLTDHKRDTYSLILLKDGQKVTMNGETLTVKHLHNEFYKLVKTD